GEEPTLTHGAPMNEGAVATLRGLRGAPAAAEAMAVERDVLLAELTGGKVHIAHASAALSVDAVRRGKARGVRVTAEATPHHLVLTDEVVRSSEYDTSTKMNPPLRSEADRQALIQGLRDGTIDCIATDHAPHTVDDKKVEYDLAAFGIVGLETAVALCLDRLVAPGLITLPRLVELLSTRPAAVLGLPGGTLAPGAPADVTVLDLSRRQKVDPARFLSKGRNTPFGGWTLKGAPVMTMVGGRVSGRRLMEIAARVARQVFGGDVDALLAFLGTPEAQACWVRLDPGPPDVVLSRLDAFLEGDDPRFIEINSDAPAGFGYGDRM